MKTKNKILFFVIGVFIILISSCSLTAFAADKTHGNPTVSPTGTPITQPSSGSGTGSSTGSGSSGSGSSSSTTKTTPTFYLFGVGKCETSTSPIECWIGEVFNWAETAMFILAPVVIVLAGVIYMTSAGNPSRITLAKKLIYGALSGVAVIVLGRFFLTNILGVWWL